MQVKNIALTNYRNIESADIDFSDGINILIGENANGKTNTIEAIYQFAHGKSFRTKNNGESISFDKEACDLTLEYISEKNNRTNKMNIKLYKDKSDKTDGIQTQTTGVRSTKRFSYNGIILKNTAEFIGNFRAVLFTPDHLGLVKGSPESRRKFIDMAISQIKPVYLSYLMDYERVLSQRNHLMKFIKEKGETKENITQFYVWTKKLVRYSAIITRYRGEYIERLKEFVPGFYAGLSNGKENINLAYVSHVNKNEKDFTDFNNFELCENLYDEVFAQCNKDELAAGSTQYGPHRDDLYIEIDEKNARSIASQGQQRSAVLSLKLAEGNISKISHGEYPVFLFDDILSELDRKRQDFILKNLSERQVIITCCNGELLKGINISKMIDVKEGSFN